MDKHSVSQCDLHGQSPSLQASLGVKHDRQHGSSAGKASVDASGSRSKKHVATQESLMLVEDGLVVNEVAGWVRHVVLSQGCLWLL